MIDTNLLRGIIAEQNTSQRQVAKMLGITKKTFYSKMKKGIFDSDEISQMIHILKIRDPMAIFLIKKSLNG